MNILIADDSKLIRLIIKNNLLDLKINASEIVEVVDGQEALTKIKNFNKLDLLITDLQMPHIDGIMLVEALRKNEKTKNTLVVAVSSSLNPNALDRLKSLGVFEFIEKPFNMETFMERIRPIIEKMQSQQTSLLTATQKEQELKKLFSEQKANASIQDNNVIFEFENASFSISLDKMAALGEFTAMAAPEAFADT